MRPCGPEPAIRDKSMPRSPASRRASGVVVAPPGILAGPKLRSGVRTSWKGSMGAVRGTGAAWVTGATGARGRVGVAGALGSGGLALLGAGLEAAPGPEITATTAPTL